MREFVFLIPALQLRMQRMRADAERTLVEEQLAREHALLVQQQKRQLEIARLQSLVHAFCVVIGG